LFDFWLRPLSTLGMLTALFLVLWAIFSLTTALAVLSIVLVMLLVSHLRNLQAFDEWLHKPDENLVPHGTGIWEGTFASLYQLMRKQTRARQELQETVERLQNAARAMPDGVVVLDELDRIEWCNSMAERHFGLNSERDSGQHIAYLLRQPQFTDYFAAHNYGEPLTLRSTRNRDMTLSIQLVPYGDKQKLLISRDITQLERLETVRRDFVANVSHEMRTPLTVVGGFLETLLDMRHLDREQTHQYLQLMLDQTHRMQRLVDDLLTLSKLESTQSMLNEADVDVPGLARALREEAVGLSAGRHKITLILDSDQWLFGSEHELRSAFSNLISNAVRYTPKGGEITLRWAVKNDEGIFSVQDTGEGIEPQHIPRLTERFYRVDHSRSRETGGTGLGLAIVKHVLSRHQARLEIASKLEEGTTFSACFPARRLLPPGGKLQE
jgi:two-component system phosphate regulon sensor histidine kinase PhoR